MKLELEFKSVAKDGLPDFSGQYIAICKRRDELGNCWGYFCTIDYSSRHKAFNAYDLNETAEYAFKDVVAYCEVPQEWVNKVANELEVKNDG